MKLFYQNYTTDTGVEGNTPIELDLHQVLEIFENLQLEEDNFLGLIDEKEKCIQFVNEGDNTWLVDIPNPPTFENLQAYATYDECVSLIKKIYKENKITDEILQG